MSPGLRGRQRSYLITGILRTALQRSILLGWHSLSDGTATLRGQRINYHPPGAECVASLEEACQQQRKSAVEGGWLSRKTVGLESL